MGTNKALTAEPHALMVLAEFWAVLALASFAGERSLHHLATKVGQSLSGGCLGSGHAVSLSSGLGANPSTLQKEYTYNRATCQVGTVKFAKWQMTRRCKPF